MPRDLKEKSNNENKIAEDLLNPEQGNFVLGLEAEGLEDDQLFVLLPLPKLTRQNAKVF